MSLQSNKSLDDWLEYISQSHPSEIEMGLDRVRAVWCELEAMHSIDRKKPKVVTVAGTNGKGSTVAMIESGLSGLGVAAGSYTSPHILRYNERVKIGDEPVSDALLIKSFEAVDKARGDIPLTYFEFGTLSALEILFSSNLDVICLEVGLGGRLDAVNIIDANVAVITSIALDHVDWLGDDIEQIGREKAGILRKGQTVFLGENLPESVGEEVERLGASATTYGHDFRLEDDQLSLLLPSNNVALAIEVIKHLKPDHDIERLYGVLNQLSLPGRLEKLHQNGCEVYLDVAHNPHAANYLAGFMSSLIDDGNEVVAVYSSLEDKDAGEVVAQLASCVESWYLAPLDVPRAMTKSSLENSVYEGLTKQRCIELGETQKNVLSFESIENAIDAALRHESDKPIVVVVFGSFFVVEASKHYFNIRN